MKTTSTTTNRGEETRFAFFFFFLLRCGEEDKGCSQDKGEESQSKAHSQTNKVWKRVGGLCRQMFECCYRSLYHLNSMMLGEGNL